MQIPTDRLLHRAARRIHEALARRNAPQSFPLPRPEWQSCCDLSRKLIRAQSAGLPLATKRLRTQTYQGLDQLRRRVYDQLDLYCAEGTRVPSARELFEDLRGLRSEFDTVKIDFPNQVLAVATESIELEEVELGAFLIKLPWGDRNQYRIKALDPHPARCDDTHTHPHVSGDRLCEGEGKSQIRNALEEGRLFDFFVLVRQVLRNYNADSAYVTLDEWMCETCSGCGDRVAPEQINCCSDCNGCFCSNCLTGCLGCDADICHSCRKGCKDCGNMITHCACCIGKCDECCEPLCDDCQHDGFCAECLEELSDAEDVPSASCAVCQRALSPEELVRCERCCVPLCKNCPESCPEHEGAFCRRCVVTCNSCPAERCRDHMNNCLECEEICCHACTENRVCARCRGVRVPASSANGATADAPDGSPSTESAESERAQAGIAVQPDCLGQAVVSPGPG
jgi:hypothetical protein